MLPAGNAVGGGARAARACEDDGRSVRIGRRPHVIACLALASLAACACASAGAGARPYPVPEAADLLEVLRLRHDMVRRVNLETRATSWLSGERVRATVEILAGRGGDLRFEAEIALAGAVAALAVHEDQFQLLDLRARVFRTGPACPANVAQVIRIPLPAAAVAAILLGDAPLPEGARAAGLAWDPELGGERLEIEIGARTEREGADDDAPRAPAPAARLWVVFRASGGAGAAGRRFDVVAVEGAAPGARQRWRVRYLELARVDGVGMPGRILFAEPGRSFDDGVEIVVKDRFLNPTLPDGVFKLEAPPGFVREAVPCPP